MPAQHVDLVNHRILLDVDVRVLGRLDLDALGRAGLGAEEAGDAAHRAVGPGGQDVVAAEPVAVVAPLSGYWWCTSWPRKRFFKKCRIVT